MSLNELFQLKKTENNIMKLCSPNHTANIMILEEDMFRVYMPNKETISLDKTWAVAPDMEDVPFEGRNRFDLSPFTLPNFNLEETSKTIIVQTTKLKAVIQLEGLIITWHTKIHGDWVQIGNDRKTQSYNFNEKLGEGVYHYLERYPEERYYGLGEKAGYLQRNNKRYQMKTIDAMGYDAEFTDVLYKHIPFYITNNSALNVSYGLFYDNYSDAIFDMGLELDNYHGLYRYYHAKKGDLDYYFILGPQISDVVEKYTRLTGKMILPPKWSIGYSGSTMTYTDAPDAQKQLKKFVESCQEFDIPCDSFQLSSGYTSIGEGRYVFHWNKDKIPSPMEMVRHFEDNGIKLSANIKPALLESHPRFNELVEKGYFVKDRNNQKPELVQFWDGLGAYIDFTNYDAITWWKDNVKKHLLEYGIASTWNDNNEYEVWNEKAMAHYFGEAIPLSYIKPIQTLLMMKASYEAQQEYAPALRPYLISRSGGPGMQRYVQTWSGDNYTEWKTIRFNIKMGLSLSLSGVYNFGHDVGGFSGMPPEPELFIRWIQNGIFHPRFTIHSWNDDQSVNVPWMYPEYIDVIRTYMKERVKWTPYMYHLFHEAHAHYQPILTPTFYHFEHDPKTFEENDDFLLGKNLLVCSVVEEGQRIRDVYLPDNQYGWFDVTHSTWYEGGQMISVDAPLEHIPLFAQAGSIIPIRDGAISFEQKADTERGMHVFLPKGESKFTERIYEDDGYTMNYKHGEFAYIHMDVQTTDSTVAIQAYIEGDYVLSYDTIAFYVPKTESRTITLNGHPVESGDIIWNFK